MTANGRYAITRLDLASRTAGTQRLYADSLDQARDLRNANRWAGIDVTVVDTVTGQDVPR